MVENCEALSHARIEELRSAALRDFHSAERVTEDLRRLISDLDAAQRVMNLFHPFSQLPAAVRKDQPQVTFSVRNPFRPGTVKAFVWEVMDTAPEPWLTSDEIRRRASILRGTEFPSGSIGPALTQLRHSHACRQGHKVALRSRIVEPAATVVMGSADREEASFLEALCSVDLIESSPW